MVSNLLSIRKRLLYAYFPVVMLHYYLAMHGINIYSFVVLPYLIVLIFLSISILMEGNNIKKNSLFAIFLLYNVLSIVNYTYNGRPLTCYLTGLRHIVFPMIFYLFGQDEKDDSRTFYRILLYSSVFCFVIGLYLYVVGPDYYKNFLMSARENVWYSSGFEYKESDVLNYSRMSSFFGFSYDVCFFSVPALVIALMFTMNQNEIIKKWLLYCFSVICWVSTVLCFHRVSMVSGILFLIFYIWYSRRNGNKAGAVVFITLIVLIISVGLAYINTDRGAVIYEMLMGRIENTSFSVAMSERSEVSENALNAWDFYIFGGGIGSFSHVAMRLGFPSVSDAEFVRILTENGVIGTLLWAMLLLGNLYRGVRNFKVYGIEVCIILFYLIACTGANALSMSYVFSPVFWYALGHIWNKSYKYRCLNEKTVR